MLLSIERGRTTPFIPIFRPHCPTQASTLNQAFGGILSAHPTGLEPVTFGSVGGAKPDAEKPQTPLRVPYLQQIRRTQIDAFRSKNAQFFVVPRASEYYPVVPEVECRVPVFLVPELVNRVRFRLSTRKRQHTFASRVPPPLARSCTINIGREVPDLPQVWKAWMLPSRPLSLNSSPPYTLSEQNALPGLRPGPRRTHQSRGAKRPANSCSCDCDVPVLPLTSGAAIWIPRLDRLFLFTIMAYNHGFRLSYFLWRQYHAKNTNHKTTRPRHHHPSQLVRPSPGVQEHYASSRRVYGQTTSPTSWQRS